MRITILRIETLLPTLAVDLASAAAVSGQQATPMANGKTSTGFVTHETPPSGLSDIYGFFDKNFGFVPNLAKVMSGSPALVRSYYDTQNNLKKSGLLTQAEINVVQMSIAVENKCEYCTAGHTMAGQAFFKTPVEVMKSVRQRKIVNDPKMNALRNFAIVVYMNKGKVGQKALQDFIAAGYTREQALDVVACVAAKVMSNYTNSLARTPLDPPLTPLAEGLPFNETANR